MGKRGLAKKAFKATAAVATFGGSYCDGPDVRTVVDKRYHAAVKLRLSE